MTLSVVVGSAETGSATAGSTVAIGTGLTDGNSGDIILCAVAAEWLTGTGAAGTVSGVSGGGLTWHNRSSNTLQFTATSGAAFASWQRAELWWAFAPSPLSAQVITATFSLPSATNFDDATILCWAVTGFTGGSYSTNPWDANVSLPAIASNNGTPARSVPTVNINTTAAATMAIGFAATPTQDGALGAGAVGSGYSYIGGIFNNGGTNAQSVDAEDQVFATPQTGTAVNWTNARAWVLIADALSQTGSGGGGSGIAVWPYRM